MSILRRLKNLWRLSALEVPEVGETPAQSPPGTVIVPFLKKNKMASIVEPNFLDTLHIDDV